MVAPRILRIFRDVFFIRFTIRNFHFRIREKFPLVIRRSDFAIRRCEPVPIPVRENDLDHGPSNPVANPRPHGKAMRFSGQNDSRLNILHFLGREREISSPIVTIKRKSAASNKILNKIYPGITSRGCPAGHPLVVVKAENRIPASYCQAESS